MLGSLVEVGGQPAGPRSRTKPPGKDEKGAMAGTTVEPSKTTHGEITWNLSAAAGRAAEERQEDDQEDIGKEDGQKGRGGGGGRLGHHSRRISPLTLLSYKWGTNGVPFFGLKDRGRGRGVFFFFFFFLF